MATRSDMNCLGPCNHEEADTRMMLHLADAVYCGYRKILIRTVDTDVVVLAISVFENLALEEVFIAFGVGQNFR